MRATDDELRGLLRAAWYHKLTRKSHELATEFLTERVEKALGRLDAEKNTA